MYPDTIEDIPGMSPFQIPLMYMYHVLVSQDICPETTEDIPGMSPFPIQVLQVKSAPRHFALQLKSVPDLPLQAKSVAMPDYLHP